nr:hypothetical protein [Tanacetum cinerariifolium]
MMASFFQISIASTLGLGPLPSNNIANPKGKLKPITTQSGLVLDGPFVPMPPPFINPEEDERVEETLTNPDLAEDPLHPYIPYPLRMYKENNKTKMKSKFISFGKCSNNFTSISLADALILILKYQKMLKALLSNKEKLLELVNTPLNENFSAVILKKLPEKLGDPEKFLIPCGLSELKCKALADLGASINLMPLLVWKKLGLPKLISTRMTLELANRAICTLAGIARDVFVLDYLEDLFATNHLSGNPTISSHTDLTSSKVINPLSGSTTSSSPNHLLKEFSDELALITFPPANDDLPFDIESDLREIEYFLNRDPTKEMDSILEDSVDECNPADPNNDLVDTILEMFTDKHTLDYSSPPLYDDFDDDLVEFESNNDDVYNDPFDSKKDNINESKLLIDELDPPGLSDFLPSPQYDSFIYKDFSEVDALPSTDNEDKVFNPVVVFT